MIREPPTDPRFRGSEPGSWLGPWKTAVSGLRTGNPGFPVRSAKTGFFRVFPPDARIWRQSPIFWLGASAAALRQTPGSEPGSGGLTRADAAVRGSLRQPPGQDPRIRPDPRVLARVSRRRRRQGRAGARQDDAGLRPATRPVAAGAPDPRLTAGAPPSGGVGLRPTARTGRLSPPPPRTWRRLPPEAAGAVRPPEASSPPDGGWRRWDARGRSLIPARPSSGRAQGAGPARWRRRRPLGTSAQWGRAPPVRTGLPR